MPMNKTFNPDLASLDEQLKQERPPTFSDEALALRLAQQYAADLRYVAAWSRWLFWASNHWQFDDTLKAFDLARDMQARRQRMQ
jgi:putative DNA primase/helicase